MLEAAGPTTHPLSRRRKALFILLMTAISLLLFELCARLVFFAKQGFNPYYLTFGFAPDIEWNSNELDGYNKFQPHTTRHMSVPGRIIGMKINGDGFRSPRDFVKPKPAGVVRIAALGASSTFGYGDTDDETYPHYLEEGLRQRFPGRNVEVINLGIPQLRMDNIVALARHELPALQADLITFYEGYNNAIWPKSWRQAGPLYRMKDWFYFHSMAWRTVHEALKTAYHRITGVFNLDLLGSHGLDLPLTIERPRVELLRNSVRQEFRRGLIDLADFADQQHVPLILVTQTMTWQARHNPVPWPSYAEEVAALKDQYGREGKITAHDVVLLIHSDLEDEVRAVAAQRRLRLVEGIQLLDVDRSHNMASMVHLTPAGNRRLATGILEAVARSGVFRSASPAALSQARGP